MWLIILSDQLPIEALVGRYPTNKLIRRGPLQGRPKSFPHKAHAVLAAVSSGYPPPLGRFPRVTHPSATHPEGPVRLACVKHAASVRSEPGSNSQVDSHVPNPNRHQDIKTKGPLTHTLSHTILKPTQKLKNMQTNSPTRTPYRPTQKPPPTHPFLNINQQCQRTKTPAGGACLADRRRGKQGYTDPSARLSTRIRRKFFVHVAADTVRPRSRPRIRRSPAARSEQPAAPAGALGRRAEGIHRRGPHRP